MQTGTPKDIQIEDYSVPRIGKLRRTISIVNPVPQVKLAKLIADEWVEIRSHLRKSKFAIKPVEILADSERAVDLPDFNLVELRKQDVLSTYDEIVLSDTSRFYSTIYTHAIPWALHTKKWCKDHLRPTQMPTYNAKLGAKPDTAVRHCQENQSIGIPIGPDTSRILAEIIAVSVDERYGKATKLEPKQAFRNVDDWFIGHDWNMAGEDIIAKLALSLGHYGLEIHPDKTKSIRAENAPPNLWPSEILRAASYQLNQPSRNNLLHFIESAIEASKRNPTENVINFAIKISANFDVTNDTWPIYESFLLRCCRHNSTSIPVATRILKKWSDHGLQISRDKIAKFVSDTILKSAPFSFHFEISWSLYLAKTLTLSVPPLAAKVLGDVESSVCALLALDCANSGLIASGLNTSKWKKQLTSDGLRSNLWLLAYEADLKGWLTASQASFVTNDTFFSKLKAKGISFYDPNRPVSVVQTRKWSTRHRGFEEYLEFLNGTAPENLQRLDLGHDIQGYGDF